MHPLKRVLFCGILPVALLLAATLSAQEKAEYSLSDLIDPTTSATVLGVGYGFCEGPAADAVGNVYFSDGAKDSIHFYAYGQNVEVFVNDSTDANGMTFNRNGELVSVEGAAYRIVAFNTRTKEKRVLASEIDGKHFNEPNDLAIDFENGFYFTDPNYGHRKQPTNMKEDVYYVSKDGKTTRVSTVCVRPNGILLTADCKTLYVGDNGSTKIYKYDVTAPGQLAKETAFINDAPGSDGMTLDANGNLYIACGGGGVKIYDKTGKFIGALDKNYGVLYASNCVFGGPNFSILYITSRDKFLGIPLKVKGILPPPAGIQTP
ncbi:MAG: SMP-30/gluconolactonase/LRE family protein [Planctomycetaceae bacterium]|jgi:gluconolactonase|nr:SMP-30/gluconolactonase/LRE family protein [Planctomycetaceae bacterium]